MKKLYLSLVILISLLLAGCTSTEPTLQIMNLGAAKNAVQGYYESGEYDKECSKIIDDAINHLNSEKVTGKSAVVFDIDETALSNYEQTKSIGFGYINNSS